MQHTMQSTPHPSSNDRLIPPQSIEAEMSVLGCIMLDRDGIIKIADLITADDFYDHRNKLIYEAIVSLYQKNIPIDILTLSSVLEDQKTLDRAGGQSYLAELANAAPNSAHIVHYASIVRKKGTLRRLISTASDITRFAFEETGEVETILDKAEQSLYGVTQKHLKQNFVAISSVLHETFERIDELQRDKGRFRGLPTGYIDLDNLLGGLQRSDLIILAARPSMGKTSFALEIIKNISTQAKIPTAIFSLEMSKDQLVDRLLASQADVNLWKIRTGNLTEQDFEKIGEAMGTLGEAQIFIDDAAGSNIMEVRTKARRLQQQHGIGLVVIDYLQLMSGHNSDNRVQEVSEISRSLKILARELNVPVIALSQLSRSVEQRPDKVPQLSDLRESGSIEQDADVVMFIYREDMYKGAESKRPHIAEIHIKKHRNGPTGLIELYFDNEKTAFKNLAKSFDTSPQTVMQALKSTSEEEG